MEQRDSQEEFNKYSQDVVGRIYQQISEKIKKKHGSVECKVMLGAKVLEDWIYDYALNQASLKSGEDVWRDQNCRKIYEDVAERLIDAIRDKDTVDWKDKYLGLKESLKGGKKAQ